MKTLWLGCSHSLGLYNENNRRLHHYGIPYYVAKKFDVENWKIVAGNGQGIIEYSNIITYLNNKNLLNFDNIIIQLTHEPRFIIYEDVEEKYKSLEKYIKSIDNTTHSYETTRKNVEQRKVFNLHVESCYERYKDTFGKQHNLKLLNIIENIKKSFDDELYATHFKIHTDNIINIVEKQNINLYTFVYHTFDTHNFFEDYDILENKSIVDCTPEEIRKDCYIDGSGHPMLDGIFYAKDLIVSGLLKNKFKG